MNKPKPVLGVEVVGLGTSIPELVSNEEYLDIYGPVLHEGEEVTAGWMSDTFGVDTRGVCAEDQTLADLLTDSSLAAARDAGWEEGTVVDALYVGTTSAHAFRLLPSVHTTVQRRLAEAGYPSSDSVPINTACASFGYGLNEAARSFGSGEINRAIVVGGDVLQRIVSKTNANTLMMGDGAGAIALDRTTSEDDELAPGFLTYYQGGDGSIEDQLVQEVGDTLDMREGEALARASARAMLNTSEMLLGWSGVSIEQIAIVVPHQPGKRIIEMVKRRLKGLDPERVAITVGKYGNISSGCIPVTLDDAFQEGKIQPGDLVMPVTVGAGMNYAGQIMRWGKKQPQSV